MKNIVVLVSGGGTNLQALIDAERSGKNPKGKITCVISSKPGVFALERAKSAGIKTKVLNRKEYGDSAAYSSALLEILRREKADLVVYAGFMTILEESVCSEFKNRMINVHPSLLPSFCGVGYYGLHVHRAALQRGVKLTGATVHFVNEECDGGPIILQKAVPTEEGDTPEILQKRVMEQAEQVILPEAVRLFCEDRIVVKNGMVSQL